jgi:hypothetical protein
MKYSAERLYSNPEAAARKLVEIANSVEAVQDGRIYIELINYPMLYELKASPAEYWAGLQLVIAHGWLTLDRSGTYVKFTQAGSDLFASSIATAWPVVTGLSGSGTKCDAGLRVVSPVPITMT